MKIDHDYLKKLLEACQASVGPTFDIEELRVSGLDYSEEGFEFHMKILTDEGLIERDDGDPGFGLFKGIDGYAAWSVLPLRLTDSGHQFIEALSDEQVWRAITQNFKGASLATLRSVSLRLLTGFLDDRAIQIVNNTAHIDTAINSPVQQAGAHSTQKQVITYGAQERVDLDHLVCQVETHLDELKLGPAALQKANAQLATLQAQLRDEPNSIIVREAGRSLRNITEGAIASLIAAAGQPNVWKWVAEAMARLFS